FQIIHQPLPLIFKVLVIDLENAEHRNAETILKELQRTKSVIAALLGIFYEDSLWEQLDAKGRYQNTLQALNQLFQAAACRQALVIELEDAHWYDGSSRAFVRDLIPEMQNYPVFILIPSRYSDDGEKPLLVDQEFIERHKLQVEEIDLNILSREALRAFAANRLEGDIHPNFLDALYRATNGNPFYLEQIIDYFKESKLLRLVDNKWNVKDSSIRVSGSINAILMARIDRLSNLVKETVKAAAVIGREFEVPILNEVLKQNEEFVKYNGNATSVLREQIETAEQGQIWRSMNELRYMFKHSLLREAVYDMQLRARLRRLHQLIAEAIEKLYSENLGERYVDLAFHYENAEVKEKTNHYLGKAADYARRNFQNEQALNFYNRLIDNYREENDKMNQVSTLLNKGSVLRHVGRWEECQTVYTEALGLAHQVDDQLLLGRSNNSLGNLLMLKGNYTEAEIYLERAVRFFDLVDDQLGQLKVNGNLGTLNFRQGQYKAAKAFFTKSISLSHDLKHRTANAQIVANLGLTYMNLGKYDEGIKAQKAQLYICQEANDKQGLAFLNTNLGIVYFEQGKYDEALECYEKGLALSEELGNKQLTSIAIGCIGTVYQRKGDYEKAMENFVLDLELCEQLGDKQGMAIAIGLIGELRSIEGEFDVAIQYLERNLALSEELGYQKGIAKAVNTLGDIYAFKGELTKSIAYYDRAIDISRHINNKLVLGYSLVEKGGVLLQLGKVQEVLGTYQEALEIAKEIGQQDLLFESLILSAKVSHLQGRQEDANRILSDLLQNARNKTEIAAVHYELHHVNPEQSVHRKQALSLYESLFETEPKYLFKERIQELKADS
ncbi:MAG: tetratricopeptide repeat protein, partial [Bacteroidota bacterium]